MAALDTVAFVLLAVVAIVSALVVVFHRSPVISALSLAFNLVAIAGFYFLLNAQFIALLQVIVYAGAIMVLILFVLMLLNVHDERHFGRSGLVQSYLGPLLAVGCAAILASAALAPAGASAFPPAAEGFGTVGTLGQELFRHFFYPFEAISLLLIVAMIGAVLLAKRRL